MKAELEALRRLRAGELRFLTEAWSVLFAARIALRWLGLPRTRRWLGAVALVPCRGGEQLPLERQVALTFLAARHHLRPLTCLERALGLEALLRRRGFQPELRIGARKAGDQPEAHAWLELDGRPLGEDMTVALRFPPLRELRSGQPETESAVQ